VRISEPDAAELRRRVEQAVEQWFAERRPAGAWLKSVHYELRVVYCREGDYRDRAVTARGQQGREPRDLIRARLDVAELASDYTTLEDRGSGLLWGRCPLHEEAAPSFVANPTRGVFRCFGCGAGGDVIRLYQLAEDVSLEEAVRALALRIGVDPGEGSP
jgi:CHC2 zinc finger